MSNQPTKQLPHWAIFTVISLAILFFLGIGLMKLTGNLIESPRLPASHANYGK